MKTLKVIDLEKLSSLITEISEKISESFVPNEKTALSLNMGGGGGNCGCSSCVGCSGTCTGSRSNCTLMS